MRVERFDGDQIVRNWPWIAQLLAPSVALDRNRSLTDVKTALIDGRCGAASVHVSNGAGLVVVEPGWFDGAFCCWMPYIAGHSNSGPKAWLRMMRELMGYFEAHAKAAGCAEMRIGGRDWSRILVGYERFNDRPHMLRKVL